VHRRRPFAVAPLHVARLDGDAAGSHLTHADTVALARPHAVVYSKEIAGVKTPVKRLYKALTTAAFGGWVRSAG
jgi:hypothetical protein